MKKTAKSATEEAPGRSDLEMRFLEAFTSLDLGRQRSLIFILAHAVEAMKEGPEVSFKDALEKGVQELDRVVVRIKEHEAKALRILRGKRRLPSSRGLRTFLG